MTELGEFAMWLAIGAGQVALWVALGPVLRALAVRIRGRPGLPADAEARLGALEQRSPATGETDLVHQRLLELEERMDFTERYLARPAEGDRLPAVKPEPAREITPTGGTR
jgi:hypothetical protein